MWRYFCFEWLWSRVNRGKAQINIILHKLKWRCRKMSRRTKNTNKMKWKTLCEVFLGKKFLFRDRPCSPFSISTATEFFIENILCVIFPSFLTSLLFLLIWMLLFVCLFVLLSKCTELPHSSMQTFTYCAMFK